MQVPAKLKTRVRYIGLPLLLAAAGAFLGTIWETRDASADTNIPDATCKSASCNRLGVIGYQCALTQSSCDFTNSDPNTTTCWCSGLSGSTCIQIDMPDSPVTCYGICTGNSNLSCSITEKRCRKFFRGYPCDIAIIVD